MIKEAETENIRNCKHRIDNVKRPSNCQLNCFECCAVFRSTSPTWRSGQKIKKKERGTSRVYKTTGDRVRIENRSDIVARADGSHRFFLTCNLGSHAEREKEIESETQK